MGDEAPLDMPVAVDPYKTDSYWMRVSIVQSTLQEPGPPRPLCRFVAICLLACAEGIWNGRTCPLVDENCH